MISRKNLVLFRLLVLTALLVPQASPAMSNFMSNVRDRMFGPRVQAPAGLIDQAREARIAAQKAERELDREIEVTGSATIATSNRYHQARDAQQWLDSEVERETRRAQKQARIKESIKDPSKSMFPLPAGQELRQTYEQRKEADRVYRRWREAGPMFAADDRGYTAEQEANRKNNIKFTSLSRQDKIALLDKSRIEISNSLFFNIDHQTQLRKMLEQQKKDYSNLDRYSYGPTEIRRRLGEIESEDRENQKKLNRVTAELNRLSAAEDRASRNWFSRYLWPLKPHEIRKDSASVAQAMPEKQISAKVPSLQEVKEAERKANSAYSAAYEAQRLVEKAPLGSPDLRALGEDWNNKEAAYKELNNQFEQLRDTYLEAQ